MERKRIYRFAPGRAEGRAGWKELLGGKGANLAEMANMGIPVPPGFTITTAVCVDYLARGRMPPGLLDEVRDAIVWLEAQTGRGFGSESKPLLLSVRSGAPNSMPGMMDTVLDLGLNDETVRGLAKQSGSQRFALDAYRRFLTMFGDVVLSIPHARFEAALSAARRAFAERKRLPIPARSEDLARTVPDSVLEIPELEALVQAYHGILADAGKVLPSSPFEQLEQSIRAVFESWNNPRAKVYRQMEKIPEHWGTAVNVQAMVFGNLGDSSATGVAFTRDPSTGERRFFGEWLPNAQGEDVVAGIRTPRPLAKQPGREGESLEETMPENYAQLHAIQQQLEQHFRDMQDLEFTIEQGKLYLLQTRNGKRSARAAVRVAVEMVREGLLHEDEALLRIQAERVQELLFPTVDARSAPAPIARGLAASPGAATGCIAFSAEAAQSMAEQGKPVVLVRQETSPEDLAGMRVAAGIVTARGGATSHAAVVARGMGRPCVAGCGSLEIDAHARRLQAHAPDGRIITTLSEGDLLTLDGSLGHVYAGDVKKIAAGLGSEMQTLLGWAGKVCRLGVRANADTPEQARQAIEFGADGIGLCRTEHMFFDAARIGAVREMILASDDAARERALQKLLPFQTADFVELFRILHGRPLNIRLLDPPLHEFLPKESEQIVELSRTLGVSSAEIERKLSELFEFNPMLGHRGVRLSISYPEIAVMQLRAILSAACQVFKQGIPVAPEIMSPLVLGAGELLELKQLAASTASEVFAAEGVSIAYEFGTMIELPRAALLADEIAEHAEFFSFGTNDLTQTTLGLSRDDSGRFLPRYVEKRFLPDDPFVTLDQQGVGQLIRLAAERGRRTRRDLQLGICGEHGGDPRSIAFCEQAGLSYVSCSPFRIPVARIAAAQAALCARA